jgi:hypothetical protein
MKKSLLALMVMLLIVAFLVVSTKGVQLFAQYPPKPSGCCKQRDWIGGEWKKTELSFSECEELNRNRDSLDDITRELGYVWWDFTCRLEGSQ